MYISLVIAFIHLGTMHVHVYKSQYFTDKIKETHMSMLKNPLYDFICIKLYVNCVLTNYLLHSYLLSHYIVT